MTIKELDQLDFDRKENTIATTDVFTKTLNKININDFTHCVWRKT
jgi:hypothetical protein